MFNDLTFTTDILCLVLQSVFFFNNKITVFFGGGGLTYLCTCYRVWDVVRTRGRNEDGLLSRHLTRVIQNVKNSDEQRFLGSFIFLFLRAQKNDRSDTNVAGAFVPGSHDRGARAVDESPRLTSSRRSRSSRSHVEMALLLRRNVLTGARIDLFEPDFLVS